MVVGEEASGGGVEEGAVGPAHPPHPTNGTSKPLTSNIHNIMGGMESTEGVKLHNHRRKLRQRFDIVRKLGQGTYGKVQLGINKETGQEVAIKTIKKAKIETEADLVRIRREIQIMSSVRHPNIIHIYEVFENREKMVLVMEYAAGGELYDYLSERKVLVEQEARRIFRQIATAVYYCHKHKICHRDLKLENILLDETGNAKIADFGLSNVFDERRLLSTFCGSPLYASPEIVKGTPYHGPEVDCWSLGVLLYTLVYGAMPFDGSNFKKLVKQISQGDYFEPKKPSPASPLVRDMLTVTPGKRADVEKICSHWWVNEGYPENCLDVAEHLASQTPVRLDLLLSLAPAPSSDKIVVPETKTQESTPVSGVAPSSFPSRSHSVGSLMELDYPGGRKSSPPRLQIPPPPPPEASAPKRKLQECPSGETGAKRKEVEGEHMEVDDTTPAKPKEKRKSIKSKTVKPAEENKVEEVVAPKETETAETEKSAKVKRKKKVVAEGGELPGENALIPESVDAINNSEPVSASVPETPPEPALKPETVVPVETPILEQTPKETTPIEIKKEAESPIKRKPLSFKGRTKTEEIPKIDPVSPEKTPKNLETRRKSSIFEKAEKFNSMSTSNMDAAANSKTSSPDKIKKLVIPGVKISDFKKAFEKKPPPTKSASMSKANSEETAIPKPKANNTAKSESPKIEKKSVEEIKNVKPKTEIKPKTPPESKPKLPIDSKPKTPEIIKPKTPEKPSEPVTPTKPPTTPVKIEPQMVSADESEKTTSEPTRKKSTTMKIILEPSPKSATLPRRTSKAEIRLNKPEFRTEIEHMVGAVPQKKVQTQRSEVEFPVSAPRQPRPYKHSNTAPTVNAFRSVSLEPESKAGVKERIIPIRLEGDPPPVRPPIPPVQQKSATQTSVKRENLSRQSTQESDTDTVRGEPIRKSPREFIIPIAIEGGGYVTPRAGSLEPSSDPSTPTTRPIRPRFMRTQSGRRMGLLSESLDGETTGAPPSLSSQVSSELGDDDMPGLGRPGFHMHKLRSSRPGRMSSAANEDQQHESQSSGDEDEDDGFEILTAESLFSTLLSRVRSLTQRLNVEDGMRPFPSTRLLSHMSPSAFSTQTPSLFSNFHQPLSRRLSEHSRLNRVNSRGSDMLDPLQQQQQAPWRRGGGGVSRDPSTADSLYSDQPRGESDGLTTDFYSTGRNNATTTTTRPTARRTDSLPDYYTRGRTNQPENTPEFYNTRRSDTEYRRSNDAIPDYRRNNDTTPEFYNSRRSTQPLDTEYRRSNDAIPDYRRSNTTTDYSRPRRYQPTDYQPESSVYGTMRQPRRYQEEPKRNRSISLNRTTIRPEQTILGRFLAQDLREASPPTIGDVGEGGGLSRRGSRKVSRFLRPDFYDTPREDSMYAKQKDELKREQRGPIREDPINRPIREDPISRPIREDVRRDQRQPSVNREDDPKSRISRAISSLQQKHPSTNLTESTLIKRAVSSDDCAQMNEQPVKGKVNSVLGMFKRLEKTPEPLSRFRRAQSVYEPSTSSDLCDPDLKKNLKTPYSPSEDGGEGQDSFDSWSVCSGETPTEFLGGEDETVGERIRRKSFFTRFNDYVAPKKQPAKASPHVAAILERDFRRPHHKHGTKKEQNGVTSSSSENRRLNSVPRGWEPQQAETDYYNQAPRSINRYGYASPQPTATTTSAPLSFPCSLIRRPGGQPHLGVDH